MRLPFPRAAWPAALGLAAVLRLPAAAAGEDLTVRLSPEAGEWLPPTAAVHLELSRPVAPDEGHLAVFIGSTDWSGLADTKATVVELRPAPLRLPHGQSEVTVYLVSPTGAWREVGRVPLRILTAGGFEQAQARPTLELALQGQPAQGRFPEQPPTPRDTYHDGSLRLGLTTRHVRSGWTVASQTNAVGVTYRNAAVRFAQAGEQAPRLDLADYQLGVQNGTVGFSAGHGVWGTHRHLISGFRSRGLGATARLGGVADLTLAAVNGTPLAGLANFSGLGEPEHRLLSATVGVELVAARPGALRLAASLLDGSVLPVTGPNQGAVRDAEESRGLGFQLQASDAAGRLRLDAGYARSRFVNPTEVPPAGIAFVPVRETTRGARYLDLSYALLQNAVVGGSVQANLTAAVRHSRVDPLYRSVAAPVGADVEENVVEVSAGLGAATSQVVYGRTRDNLAELPSILTTRSAVWSWTTAVPLSALAGGGSPVLPTVTYTLGRTLQKGDGLPSDALFDSLSQVPDQLSTNHTAGLLWQGAVWRGSYTFNRSFQDNRQLGREAADLENLVHAVQLGVSPSAAFDATLDLAFETADNHELARLDVTRRIGLAASWRPAARTALAGTVTTTFLRDDPETSERRVTDFNVQLSQGVGLSSRRPEALQGQLFVRFARQTLWTLAFPDLTRVEERFWTLDTGLTFRPF